MGSPGLASNGTAVRAGKRYELPELGGWPRLPTAWDSQGWARGWTVLVGQVRS